MKLHATVSDLEMDVEIRRKGGRLFGRVDGREYELDSYQSNAKLLLRTADGKTFDCRVEGQTTSGQSVDVFIGPRRYAVTLTDPKRLRGARVTGTHADGAARIVAAMPGKVVRVLVEPGTKVEAGAGIIVVEAMKMQNEIKAPKAGVVTVVNVAVGATVNGGDVLAVIE
jgi:biotin carboxyl carrier protein